MKAYRDMGSVGNNLVDFFDRWWDRWPVMGLYYCRHWLLVRIS